MTTHTLLAFVLPFALSATACSKQDDPKSSAPVTTPAGAATIPIAVTENGFEPEAVEVPAGKPVTMVFTRKTDKTCAKQVVLTMDDGHKIEKELPLDRPVELAATFPTAGKLSYACGMDMIKGTIVVQ